MIHTTYGELCRAIKANNTTCLWEGVMDKEKIIEAMQFAYKDALCNADATPKEAWEVALKALCKELPEIKDVMQHVV